MNVLIIDNTRGSLSRAGLKSLGSILLGLGVLSAFLCLAPASGPPTRPEGRRSPRR